MTDERRQDVVLVALVASVLIHAALMFAIRPRVMTSVTSAPRAPRANRIVTVRDAPPEMVESVFAALPDTAPEKAEPTASADEFAPAAFAFASPEAAASESLAVPEAPAAPAVAPEVGEAADRMPLAQKIRVLDVETGSVTPIAENAPLVTAPVASAPIPPVASFSDVVAVPEEAPAAVDFRPSVAADAPVLPDLAAASDARPYEPLREVMREVDERTVLEERRAVRGLLDTRRANELARCVTLSCASAESAGWTYFRVTVSPAAELPTVPKDVVILLDASGSIGNDRLTSCRKAARQILRSCSNTADRFNLVAFRDRFSYAFRTWQECDQASFAAADKWLANLAAHGRTDVFATIRSVLTLPRDPKRPLVAMVVTDGDANSGVSETAEILSRFTALNDGLVSVYMYGVKERANRELLDLLTHGNRGESFIFEGSRWSAGSELETLARRFRDPVLSDLRLVQSSDATAEIYPRLLRNLYRGESVSFCGRVPAGTRSVSFSLRGLNAETAYEGFFTVSLADAAFDAGLPSDWAAERNVDLRLR